jgi:hypothetical protein
LFRMMIHRGDMEDAEGLAVAGSVSLAAPR